jgi:NADH-quinone oxidoreductase subunit L
MDTLPWTVLFLPLLAAAVTALFTLRDPKRSAALSIGSVVAGFILTIISLAAEGWGPRPEMGIKWLAIGGLVIEFGLRLDPLSRLMMLIVTGVASAIHIYSWGYMRGDRGFSRYFACLSFFTFSMLGIVLANNFLQLFIFWELVGVSSYLLIAFWYDRPAAADAGKKAFLTTRLGDFGFLLGILTVWATFGSLNFGFVQEKLALNPQALGTAATVVGLLIFCGAMGKSAQFPLHVWLPDAMEGPTPVSALIHAATMVAAGVYMLCRVFFLLNIPGSHALEVIAWVGGFTALFSAVIAIQQNDIKRILAYSTLSQLGYMVMGVGLSGPAQSMFHLTTHAFFKALLFLGAGSVIIALHHEQDIWNMGALRKKMPVTFWTFLVGTLALAGVWPFSGFYSKDALLAQAMEKGHYALFALGWLVAVLTAFYMLRLVLVVFFDSPKSDASGHAQESPPVMAWPLRVLAVFSIIGGLVGIEGIYERQFGTPETTHLLSLSQSLFLTFTHSPIAAVAGLLAAVLGFAAAYALYAGAANDPLPEKLGGLARAMRNRFYFDELYAATVIRFHDWLSTIADWFDRWMIAGLVVRGTHGTTELVGRALRLLQTGNLQTYAFLFALGVALVLYLALR